MHTWRIGSLYRQERQRHGHRPIQRMSVDGACTIFTFESCIVYVPIGFCNPFLRYWQPLLGSSTATWFLTHPENECQWSVIDFRLRILGNLYSDWLQTSIHQILAAFTGKNNRNMLPVASWKWISADHQQLQLSHSWYSRHCADLCVHNGIIDRPDRQKYNASKVNHRFENNWHCKPQSRQQHIIGWWKCDFDKLVLANSKNMSHIWIYGWIRWATRWQPSHIWQVGSSTSNRTRVDVSGVLTTPTANLVMVRFGPGPGPGPEVTVQNRW